MTYLAAALHAPDYACSMLLSASDWTSCASCMHVGLENCDVTRYETVSEEQ